VGAAESKKVVLGFIEAMNKGDMEAIGAALAEDVSWWFPGSLPWSGTHKGRETIFRDLFGPAMSLFEPGTLSWEVRNAIGEGDQVAVEWVVRGRSTSGRDYENDYSVMFRVKEGEIQAIREYVDTLHTKEVLLG
jgi:ketosteroid isomerase-like protein